MSVRHVSLIYRKNYLVSNLIITQVLFLAQDDAVVHDDECRNQPCEHPHAVSGNRDAEVEHC